CAPCPVVGAAVGTDWGWLRHIGVDRAAGLRVAAYRLARRRSDNPVAQALRDLRRDGGDDRGADLLRRMSRLRQVRGERGGPLVGRALRRRVQTPMRLEPVIRKQTDRRLGVADVEREEHGAAKIARRGRRAPSWYPRRYPRAARRRG